MGWCDPYGVRVLLRRRVLGVCEPGSRAAFAGGGAALVPLSWYALPGCGSRRLPWCSLPLCLGPRPCPFPVLGWFPAPTLCLFRCPVPMGACPSVPPCLSVPCCPLPYPCPCPFPSRCGGGWVGGGAPMAQARGWVAWSHWRRAGGVWEGGRPWTASWRRASHAACGMMASGAASLGSAGVRVRTSSKVCTMCTPSRLSAPPAHFTQRRSSCKAGADHQAR